MGDPAGVGPEVTVKALNRADIYAACSPVVVGDLAPLSDAVKFCGLGLALNAVDDVKNAAFRYGAVDVIDAGMIPENGWAYKKADAKCGKAAFEYIRRGAELAVSNAVHGVVTGPVCKESINLAGFAYNGHTEILADFTHTRDYSMLLMNGPLRVFHVTTHVPLAAVSALITTERVLNVIRLADKTMKQLSIKKPRVAVAGLNPHAGENALFGREEQTAIAPAVALAITEEIIVDGPLPPDTAFVKAAAGMYDVVVAMYHDQGHIPLKFGGFKVDPATGKFMSVSGVNCTVGLPIIRTSVDHGTAFDIAGDGVASADSMAEAIKTAVLLARTKFTDGCGKNVIDYE